MSTHKIHRLIALGTLTLALMLPARLVAQSPESATSAPVAVQTDGPRMEQAGVTRATIASASAALPAPQQFRDDRRNVAWMVVGGAALVVGSMVGGDAGTIIMVTGGVIGLVGLFRYMQ